MIFYSRLITILLLGALVLPRAASAGGTRVWELAGFTDLDQGETDGTLVSSEGEVSLGYREKKLDLKDVGVVWSAVRDRKGTIYLGTGYDGKIFRVRGGKVDEIATTGQLVVTSLALDKKGNLYASTLPDPIIWKVNGPGKIGGKPEAAKEWAKLPEGTKHVFAIAFDQGGANLFAGTGPEGKLFAIGKDKKASVYLDSEEEHILCIAAPKKGELVVGTSPGAMLLKISGPGRSSALADFDGTEVKAVVVRKDDIFAAVNKFKSPPAVPKKTQASTKNVKGTGTKKKTQTKSKGEGKFYRVDGDGKFEELFSNKKSHIVSLAGSKKGEVFIGFGFEGKVVAVDRERVSRTVLDVDERQVTALIAGDDFALAATGDAGAVYSISRSKKADALYYSPPLDAQTVSKWGALTWYTTGKLKVQSRSGNTKLPGKDWSDWSKPIGRGNPPPSPKARYIQLRFSWALGGSAALVSAELAYKPQNERATIKGLDPDSSFPKSSRSSSSTDNYVSKRTVKARPKGNSGSLNLTWTVNNPDEDTMRYQLWYRAVGTKVWRPITKPDKIITAKRYSWVTKSVPEGRYQIRLRADDSPSNDPKEALSDEYISVPVLVDNHQPEVVGLAFTKGVFKGLAKDGFSAISHLEFSVDAGPWMPIFSSDGVFDEKKEEFEFAPPDDIEPGPHAVAVRAFDRVGNLGSAELHVDIKKTNP